jgi:hypothetical protein
MKETETVLLVLFLAFLLFAVYFIQVKGDKKRLTFSYPEMSVTVEVADNPITRAKGLMGRSELGDAYGMLFVFDKMGKYPFWMLNTTIPLDAVYLSEDGTVVDILQMEPCGLNITQCRQYVPQAEARYVLEVNQGFSKKHGIEIGKSKADMTDFS